MPRRTSIRVRLTVGVALVTAVFLGLGAALFSARTSDAVLDGVRADQIEGAVFASPLPLAPAAADLYRELAAQGRLAELWRVLGVSPPSAGVRVVIADATALSGTAENEVVVADGPIEGQVFLDATTVLSIVEALLQGVSPNDLLVIGGAELPTGAIDPATTPASVDVATVVPVGNVRSSVRSIEHELWIAAALLTAFAAGATWLLTGRTLHAVDAITRRVDEISCTGSGERVPVPSSDDEIGHLARTVNTMLDRLDTASRAQRQFVADASHELRSPLAVLRAEAEVSLAHPTTADWPATARSVLEETGRLEALVDDLLVLARLDERQDHPSSVLCDVDEVVRAEAARARRVPIDLRRVLAGRVAAPSGTMTRVVRHLLDNAARHARARVEVGLGVDGRDVVLTVDDDGDGIAPEDRERIFERFARLEESRSRDNGGAGLGLAVVSSLVTELGGTVRCETAPIGGARFTVRLPADGPDPT